MLISNGYKYLWITCFLPVIFHNYQIISWYLDISENKFFFKWTAILLFFLSFIINC